ncbi:IS1380 family transposase, partial [Acidobacteria bacterium AH-259-O06]|nr:IS1380 family transposase [Acidobacteria bacterium AH-259-O06]
EAIDQGVTVFKRHQPYHESDHILSLIYNVSSGGTRLQDVESRRKNVSYLEAVGAEKIPAPSTAGDFLRRFSEADVVDLMEAVQEPRLKVWRQQAESFFERADLDIDGTIAPTWGECKEGIDVNYKGEWGYGPLMVSLANTGEVLYAVNRPASRPSHEGAPEWIDRAIALVRGGGFRKVRLRGDTDFSLTRHFDRWTDDGVEFNFGIDAHPSFVARADALPEEAWSELVRSSGQQAGKKGRKRRGKVKREIVRRRGFKNLRLEREEVAELEYRPTQAEKTYRMIVLRKSILVEKGQQRLLPETRYHFYVTNVAAEEMTASEVVRENNRRCNQENVIEQLKNGVEALRMPSDTLVSNWAYLVIAAQAWNLKAWLGLVLPHKQRARQILRMEFRRFLQEIIQLPCQILRSGRRLIYRLLQVNSWTRLLLEASAWLKQQCLT